MPSAQTRTQASLMSTAISTFSSDFSRPIRSSSTPNVALPETKSASASNLLARDFTLTCLGTRGCLLRHFSYYRPTPKSNNDYQPTLRNIPWQACPRRVKRTLKVATIAIVCLHDIPALHYLTNSALINRTSFSGFSVPSASFTSAMSSTTLIPATTLPKTE